MRGIDERYERAGQLFNRGKAAEAYELYDQLARAGDPNCQVFLGWMIYSGYGTRKDESAGLEWFGKAAALGSAAGAFYCGRHALNVKNYEQALRFFYQAAEKEYTPALLWVGLAHLYGHGVPVNEKKAIAYLERSAEAGHFLARRTLAVMMIKGKFGVARIGLGLLLFPYIVIAALIDGMITGYSEKIIW